MCPNCANDKSKIISTKREVIVFRVRECTKCGFMWKTQELTIASDNSALNEHIKYEETYVK